MSLDLEVLGNKNFFEFVETKISNIKLTSCRHVGSVTAFDGYIVTVSSLPCIVGSLCSIEMKVEVQSPVRLCELERLLLI